MSEPKLTPIPQDNSSTFMERHPSLERLTRNKKVLWSLIGLIATHASRFFNWGERLLNWIQTFDYFKDGGGTLLKVLSFLFSPRGADVMFLIMLVVLCVTILLVVNPKEVSQQAGIATPEDSNAATNQTVKELAESVSLLESEKTALEKARDGAIRAHEEAIKKIERLQQQAETKDIQISARDGELQTLKTKYQWLHEEAERDKSSLSRYVYIIFRKVNYEGLTELEPYIEIIFNIINASVYNIIIDENIKGGAVYFNDIELNPKMAKLDGSLHSIKRGDDEKRFLIIKQWLSPELAKRISNSEPNDELHLDRLKLMVRAYNSDLDVTPQRLSLPSTITVTAPALKKDPKRERIKEQLEAILEEGYNVALIGRDTVYQSEIDQYNRWRAKAEGFVRVQHGEAEVKRFQQDGLQALEELLKDYLD